MENVAVKKESKTVAPKTKPCVTYICTEWSHSGSRDNLNLKEMLVASMDEFLETYNQSLFDIADIDFKIDFRGWSK